MKRVLHFIELLSLLFLLVFLLISCSIKNTHTNIDGGNGNANNAPVDFDGVIWSENVVPTFIYAQDQMIDINEFYTFLCSATPYGTVHVKADASEIEGSAIVLGKTSRDVSSRAYRHLERNLDDKEDYDGWVMYCKDSQLAIAYSSKTAAKDAANYFYSNFNVSKLELDDGVIAEGYFDVAEHAAESREKMRSEGFAKVAETLGEDVAKEIEKLYTLYGEEIYIWVANLWDPVTGGFYYSQSGRDNDGYLPDLESTNQLLVRLASSGLFSAYGDSYVEALKSVPGMSESIVNFVKNLQSPTDGYFYHPQWKTVGDNRRGRDLDWATNLLKSFGAKPYYDTPNGIKGEVGAPGAVSTASLTVSLSASSAKSVSKVIPVSSSTLPSYLQSLSAWEGYLSARKWSTQSYIEGNTVAAIATQIRAAGQEYVDFLISFLNEKQNPENGLWEKEVTIGAMNGLMKITSMYSTFGKPMNYIQEAMNSTIYVALLPELNVFGEGSNHVCSIYNAWACMAWLYDNAKKFGNLDLATSLRQQVLDNAKELIELTHHKMANFKRSDGGFSYKPNMAAYESQGALVGVPNTLESDVNATTICWGGTLEFMFHILGVDKIYTFCEEDGEIFLELIGSMGEIIKNEPPEPTITDFEEDPLEYHSTYSNIVTKVDDYVVNKLPNPIISSVTEDLYYQYQIVADPQKSANKVLKVSTYYGGSNDMASDNKSTDVSLQGETHKTCFAFSARLRYSNYDKNGVLTTFNIFNSGYAAISKMDVYVQGSTTKIDLRDPNNGYVVLASVEKDKWFDLDIEVYLVDVDTEANTATAVSKYYVDGEFVYESYRSTTALSAMVAQIVHQRGNTYDTYIDDVWLRSCDKKYEGSYVSPEPPSSEEPGDEDENESFEPTEPGENEPSETMTDFEGVPLEYDSSNANSITKVDNYVKNTLPGKNVHSATGKLFHRYHIVKDPENATNRVLKVSTYFSGSYSDVANSIPSTDVSLRKYDDVSCFAFSTRLRYSNYNQNGVLTAFNIFNEKYATISKMDVYVKGSTTKIDLRDPNNGYAVIASVEKDKWFDLKFEVYFVTDSNTTTAITKYFVDGEFVYQTTKSTTADSPLLVQIQHQRGNTYDLYIDDVFFSAVTKSEGSGEEPNKPSVPSEPGESKPFEPTITDFEGNSLEYHSTYTDIVTKVDDYVVNNLPSPVVSSVSGKYYYQYQIANDPESATNKVLKVSTYFGGTSDMASSNKSTDVSLQANTGDACFTFSTRLRYSSYDKNGNLTQFNVINENGRAISKMMVNVEGATTKIKLMDLNNSNAVIANVVKDQWFDLKVEVYLVDVNAEANTATAITKYYVNGDFVYESSLSTTAHFAKSVQIVHQRGNVYDAYIDDVVFYSINKEYILSGNNTN